MIEEEMRREIEFCRWKASWWAHKKTLRKSGIPHLDEGINSYASEQAEAELQRMVAWSTHWAAIRPHAAKILENCLGDEDDTAIGTIHIEIEDDDDILDI